MATGPALQCPFMSKQPAIRFSLFTLLVVLMLAAVSVSHVRTSWERAQAKRDAQSAQRQVLIQDRTIRQLNNALGRLTIGDPTQVHVINASPCWRDGTFDPNRPPLLQCWNLHLPEGTRWKVWWATQDIPVDELPDSKSGGFELASEHERAHLSAQFSNPPDLGFLVHGPTWALIVSDASDLREHVSLDRDRCRWLGKNASVSWEGIGGDQDASPHTAVLPPDGPIVLQRIRRQPVEESAGQIAEPRDGFMIWIEPWQP